jgi:nucleotide-binding universal stress UspA family protein
METTERIIVCGVDGSPAGQRALMWALEEAGRRADKVRAVTGWVWDGVESLNAASTPAEALAQAQRLLDRAVDEVLGQVPGAVSVERVCQRGLPSDAICAAAADAELIVLGSHGHGAVHDKLIGSTSERVIHHAPCPVVVVPDPRHVERNLKRAKQLHREPARPAQVL